MSRPIDFDTLLADWLADDGPSDAPARVAQGAITQVQAMTRAGSGGARAIRPLGRPFRATRILALAAALALLGAIVALAFALLRPSPSPMPPTVTLPANGVIVASEDGDVILVDSTTGEKQVLPDNLGDDTVTSVSPDGRTIAWWSQDEIEHTWSLMVQDIGPAADGSSWFFPVEQPGEVAWAPGSNLVAISHTVGDRLRLTIQDRKGGDFEDFPDLDAYGATWRPDGTALAVLTRDGSIPELVQVPTTGGDPVVIARGEPADPSSAEALQLWSAAWSPDGEHIAYVSNVTGSGGPDGSPSSGVFVMDADGTDARLVGTLADGTTQGLVRWSADSQRLLVRVLSADSTAFVLQPIDGSPGTEVARLDGRSSRHVAWSPDETKLVAARQHEPARIIDLASGDVVLQSWMSAYDLAWQPIPPPAE